MVKILVNTFRYVAYLAVIMSIVSCDKRGENITTQMSCGQVSNTTFTSAPDLTSYSVKELSRLLMSGVSNNIVFAFAELDERINRGEIRDIANKHEIYTSCKSSGELFVAANVAAILARMPLDQMVVEAAKQDMQSNDISYFAAGYRYISTFDPEYAEHYFRTRYNDYEKIDDTMRWLFSSTPPFV